MSKPGPLKTTISTGQRYYDEPIRVYPKKTSAAIAAAVQSPEIIGYIAPKTAIERPIPITRLKPLKGPITTGHNRLRLRWMEPDGNGGLRPKPT
jgi:hypothetical protein